MKVVVFRPQGENLFSWPATNSTLLFTERRSGGLFKERGGDEGENP